MLRNLSILKGDKKLGLDLALFLVVSQYIFPVMMLFQDSRKTFLDFIVADKPGSFDSSMLLHYLLLPVNTIIRESELAKKSKYEGMYPMSATASRKPKQRLQLLYRTLYLMDYFELISNWGITSTCEELDMPSSILPRLRKLLVRPEDIVLDPDTSLPVTFGSQEYHFPMQVIMHMYVKFIYNCRGSWFHFLANEDTTQFLTKSGNLPKVGNLSHQFKVYNDSANWKLTLGRPGTSISSWLVMILQQETDLLLPDPPTPKPKRKRTDNLRLIGR